MGFSRDRSKSFGEPNRVRMDGTRAEAQDEAPKPRGVNTAYERYKQQLHSFFDQGKPLPDHLRDMLSTRPGAGDHGFTSAEGAEGEASATTDRKSVV